MNWERWGKGRLNKTRNGESGTKMPADGDPEPETSSLGPECEEYLAGRYLNWLTSHGHGVPAWAWFNALAHGEPSEVAALAQLDTDPNDPQRLVSDIARVLLQCAQSDGVSIPALQRSVLLPLEGKLSSLAGSLPADSANELAAWLALICSPQPFRL